MTIAVLLASLHYLAVGMGLGALFARGLHFRGLKRPGSNEREELNSALMAHQFWGLAAALWIITGFWRAFGHVEKPPDFYLHNPFFFIKLGLFGVILILEILPVATLFRWGVQLRKKGKVRIPKDRMGILVLLNDIELWLLVLIFFVTAAMARGLWQMP